jgi:hypothetical protein
VKTHAPSILRALQCELEALHAVDTQLDVDAYSIDDEVRKSIPQAIDGLVEQLFVRDEGDALEIALYVAPHVLARLHKDDPRQHLHPGNFEAFCIALEGVSHFVFLAWRADLGRPVTALELELQAEVDKFVVSWLWVLSGRAHPAITADSLLAQLFDGYALHDDVPLEQHERYAVASRAAHNICRRLVQQAGDKPQVRTIMQAARLYFRRGLSEKLQAA